MSKEKWPESEPHTKIWPHDINEHTVWAGGVAGGRFLDKLGKTDLATLTKMEYCSYIQAVIKGFVKEVDSIPF